MRKSCQREGDVCFKDIVYKKDQGIAYITINRPNVCNAFRFETIEELICVFEDSGDEKDIGVVVLTGAGGNFSTGGDVNMEANFDASTGRKLFRRCLKLSTVMRNLEKPIIAGIRGYCVGGGNELNMLCDLTIAEDNAKFGQAGPRVGSAPMWYGTQMLSLTVGDKKAREIVYMCRLYDAYEAEKMGWINKVVKEGELESEIDKWCKELLTKSPQALRIAKYSLNYLSDMMFPSVTHGLSMVALSHTTDEFKEGMNAFLEKRPPDFRGVEKVGEGRDDEI